MDKLLNLNFYQLLSAYIFILILLILTKIKGISREKEIIIATLRMSLQLTLAGYMLVYIIKKPSPVLTILILLGMEIFCIFNIIKQSKEKISKNLKKVIAVSILAGTLSCLLYFLFVIVRIKPWYNAQYFIPIAGMLIGNSMTGIALGVNKLITGIEGQKNLILSALMLGATPKMATKDIVSSSFDAALIPTINSMLGMGIVFLPGMMTGQILSGVSPISAIEYQIVIMLGILGSVSLSVYIFLHLGYKTFFNENSQLVLK